MNVEYNRYNCEKRPKQLSSIVTEGGYILAFKSCNMLWLRDHIPQAASANKYWWINISGIDYFITSLKTQQFSELVVTDIEQTIFPQCRCMIRLERIKIKIICSGLVSVTLHTFNSVVDIDEITHVNNVRTSSEDKQRQ